MYKKMPFQKKALMIFSFWLFFTAGLALAGHAEIDVRLKIDDHRISANLKNVRLAVILEILEKEKGIQVISPAVLLDEKITVTFTNLVIEKGLRRLLACFNHSLIFNEKEEVTGAMIFDSVDKSQHLARNRYKKPKRRFEKEETQYKLENTGIHGAFQIIPNSIPPENQLAEPIDTIISKNSIPPERTNVVPVDTNVIKNVSAPGKPTPGINLPAMLVKKNCPPPCNEK
jgi:hypothetical protein